MFDGNFVFEAILCSNTDSANVRKIVEKTKIDENGHLISKNWEQWLQGFAEQSFSVAL